MSFVLSLSKGRFLRSEKKERCLDKLGTNGEDKA